MILDIDNLTTSRETDALIAELIMGYKVLGYTTCVYADGDWTIHPDTDPNGWACHAEYGPVYLGECYCDIIGEEDLLPRSYRFADHSTACLKVVPHYTFNIADAWALMEKEDFSTLFLTRREKKWVFLKQISPDVVFVEAETAPLAICKAALKLAQQKTWTIFQSR